MPFIHIRSLPLEFAEPVGQILCKINHDFSVQIGVPLEHIHSSWSFFQPGHYAKGDQAPNQQQDTPLPLLVELLTPDFNKGEVNQKMLQVLASSLAVHSGLPIRKIFIHHCQARSAMVFDDGGVVRWD